MPAGRLSDLWGRRSMMVIFFFGMGAAALVCASVQNAWQMAAALALPGAFSAICHSVGIPMLLQHATKPGVTIGINGLAGNLGIAFAAILTGFMVKYAGWRMSFVLPGLLSIACGFLFMRITPTESESPAKRKSKAPVRLAVSFGISSLAVYSLGPAVKAAGFATLLLTMAVIACCTAAFVLMLPGEPSDATSVTKKLV